MRIEITMSNNHQKWINKYFPKSPIAYQPGLSLVFHSTSVGIMLSQLLYWHGKGKNKDGWVFKTIDEMRAETGLSRNQQDTAIQKCINAGILDYKLGGIPAKRHFRLNIQELENQLPSLKESANVAFLNPPTQFAENRQTLTKNTQNTTSKNTKDRFKKYSTSSLKEILFDHYPNSSCIKPNDFGKKEEG